jgi:hypothetical protein
VNTAGVRDGDVIECDVRGRRFFALVQEKLPAQRGVFRVRPITAGVTYRTVKAVEVIGHYRRSKTSARAREEAP